MKLKLLGVAVGGFVVGAGAFWGVSTHTHWLRFVHQRSDYRAVDTANLAWVKSSSAHVTYFMKFLFGDANSGEVAMLVRYPAGQINPAHKHPIGHGMYVLQGKLVTHRGTYGPGSFVWFPPDEAISHGAGPDEDVVVIFMTQSAHTGLGIDYVQAAPHPMATP